MRNVFVEGIQGAGKSTLVGHLAKALPQLHVCREGDYSPVDLTAHLAHRQQLELRIIREVIGDAVVILPAKMWELDAVRARLCGGLEEGCRA